MVKVETCQYRAEFRYRTCEIAIYLRPEAVLLPFHAIRHTLARKHLGAEK